MAKIEFYSAEQITLRYHEKNCDNNFREYFYEQQEQTCTFNDPYHFNYGLYSLFIDTFDKKQYNSTKEHHSELYT